MNKTIIPIRFQKKKNQSHVPSNDRRLPAPSVTTVAGNKGYSASWQCAQLSITWHSSPDRTRRGTWRHSLTPNDKPVLHIASVLTHGTSMVITQQGSLSEEKQEGRCEAYSWRADMTQHEVVSIGPPDTISSVGSRDHLPPHRAEIPPHFPFVWSKQEEIKVANPKWKLENS